MIYIDGIITQLQRSGGISVYFDEIIQRLVRDDLQFQFSSYGNGDPLGGITKESNDERLIQMKPRHLERYRRSPINSGASVFHSSYYRIPQDRRIATVTTVHDFTYERNIGGLRTAVHRRQKNAAIRRADAVICVSHATRRDLLELVEGCDPDRAYVIHNGVSDAFTVLPEVPTTGRPSVVFVGARGGYKNFDLAVRIISQLQDHELVAVGGGGLSTPERDLVARYLPDRFRHVGFVSNSELNMLYNAAEFLLYPSSYEGFGIPILEAMRAGCPAVAVRSSSIPEIAGSAGYLAEDASEGAVLQVVTELLEDHDGRLKRIQEGLEWSREFSWEKTYTETRKLYSRFSNYLENN